MTKLEFIEKATDILSTYGWERSKVEGQVNIFIRLQGRKAFNAMKRFILKMENKMSRKDLAFTLRHDFDGCGSRCFMPRTSKF